MVSCKEHSEASFSSTDFKADFEFYQQNYNIGTAEKPKYPFTLSINSISARQYVGIFPLKTCGVTIHSKCSINFAELAAFCIGYEKPFTPNTLSWVGENENNSFFGFEEMLRYLFANFVHRLEKLLFGTFGLLKGTSLVCRTSSSYKGSVDFAKSAYILISSGSVVTHLPFSTFDVQENRIVKTAAVVLVKWMSIFCKEPTIEARLKLLKQFIKDTRQVKEIPRSQFKRVPMERLERRNMHYKNVLELSQIILGIEHLQHGSKYLVNIPSFCINMNVLFEKCIVKLIQNYCESKPANLQVCHGEEYPLSKDRKYNIIPDIVITDNNRKVLVVGDVKYRPKITRDAIYQVNTYCTVLNADTGFILNITNSLDAQKHEIITPTNTTTSIHLFTLAKVKSLSELKEKMNALMHQLISFK